MEVERPTYHPTHKNPLPRFPTETIPPDHANDPGWSPETVPKHIIPWPTPAGVTVAPASADGSSRGNLSASARAVLAERLFCTFTHRVAVQVPHRPRNSIWFIIRPEVGRSPVGLSSSRQALIASWRGRQTEMMSFVAAAWESEGTATTRQQSHNNRSDAPSRIVTHRLPNWGGT
jgi:hypothetical protein